MSEGEGRRCRKQEQSLQPNYTILQNFSGGIGWGGKYFIRGAPFLFMLLLRPSPEPITCFVEGNTANFSLIGLCTQSKGCSLDDWHFGSYLTAMVCVMTWQMCHPGYGGDPSLYGQGQGWGCGRSHPHPLRTPQCPPFACSSSHCSSTISPVHINHPIPCTCLEKKRQWK